MEQDLEFAPAWDSPVLVAVLALEQAPGLELQEEVCLPFWFYLYAAPVSQRQQAMVQPQPDCLLLFPTLVLLPALPTVV
jgi:hypothetical protein